MRLNRFKCVLITLVLLCVVLIGCANPYFNPDTSKALSELKQVEQNDKQTKALERIADALEKISSRR